MVTEFVTQPPPVHLRGAVVRLEGFAERTQAPLARREVAYPAIPVIISFGPRWRVDRARHRSFVAGLYDAPTVVSHDGEAHCVQLDLTPLAAHALFGVAMHELSGRTVGLEDLLGERAADELVERLATAADWGARFALLDRWLTARLGEAPVPAPDAVYAWRRLRETGGRLPIEALAKELGCSRRHLGARFREQIGLPPKSVARIVRFHRAVGLMLRGEPWPEIAQDCGYYDQPHFNRDFRALAGTTPGDYLAGRLPDGAGVEFTFVQDASAAAA